jgi:hypothetical protein
MKEGLKQCQSADKRGTKGKITSTLPDFDLGKNSKDEC